MKEFDKPYLTRRFGRWEYIGWERLYQLDPGPLSEYILKDLDQDRLLYLLHPDWWRQSGEWCCPRVILDNIMGVIPCFDMCGELDRILLVTLIGTKEIIKEYPASEKKLDKACKKLLTDARKLLREKSINCEEREFRNGHKFLDYTDGEYPDSPVQLNLRIELWTLAEAEIRTKLRRDEKRERLESYPDFDDYCYRYIRSQINRRLEIEEGSVIEKTIEKVAPGLFDRALYEHLYEIAKGNDKNLTFGDCLNRIAYSVCAVVTSPTLFEYGEDAHLRSIGAK